MGGEGEVQWLQQRAGRLSSSVEVAIMLSAAAKTAKSLLGKKWGTSSSVLECLPQIASKDS